MWQPKLAAATLIFISLNLAMAQVQPKMSHENLDGLNDDSNPRPIVSCKCSCYENLPHLSSTVQSSTQQTILNEPNSDLGNSSFLPDFNNNINGYHNKDDESHRNYTINNDVSVLVTISDQKPNKENMCVYVPPDKCRNDKVNQNPQGHLNPFDDLPEVCCEFENVIKTEEKITKLHLEPKKCGQLLHNVGAELTGRIGRELRFEEFPWVVEIYTQIKYKNEILKSFCVGTLIHPQAVLTSAHCVLGKKPEEVDIIIGNFDSRSKKKSFPNQYRNVSNVIVHEKYPHTMLNHNFAILILSTPVDLINVNVLCLPEKDAEFETSRCSTIRWNTKFHEGTGRMVVEDVDLYVVPMHECQNHFLNTMNDVDVFLDKSLICAGADVGLDTCKMNIGTPLVCALRGDRYRFVQAGITMGTGCNKDGNPVLYANVADARTWIDEHLTSHNLNTTAYE